MGRKKFNILVGQKTRCEQRAMKLAKRKAKSAALVWKEFGLTAGYHSHTAPAAKGNYCITPTFEREVFNDYLVSQMTKCAPSAPNLTDAVKAWTPRQLFWIIKHGGKMTGMASFGATHDDDEVWSIVAFIEKLTGMSAEQYRQLKPESFGGTREPMTHH
jgi:hypothetical protein